MRAFFTKMTCWLDSARFIIRNLCHILLTWEKYWGVRESCSQICYECFVECRVRVFFYDFPHFTKFSLRGGYRWCCCKIEKNIFDKTQEYLGNPTTVVEILTSHIDHNIALRSMHIRRSIYHIYLYQIWLSTLTVFQNACILHIHQILGISTRCSDRLLWPINIPDVSQW